MDLEKNTKESPLEKAKRLKAEKESKDQSKIEAEAKKQADVQAKTEKINALNSEKQNLENQLNEVDIKIEASKSEAHETRDTMKEADLDKDEDFKEEYNSTISEVAENLNELRNEKNRIKIELEQINSNIENFDINEAINEGEEATQEAVENIKQENKEVVTQIESYPGSETEDIEEVKEVVENTEKEVNEVVENTKKEVKETTEKKEKNPEENNTEKENTTIIENYQEYQKFYKEQVESGNNKKSYEILLEYLGTTMEEYRNNPETKKTFDKIACVPNYQKIINNPYVKNNYDSLSVEHYSENQKEINNAIFNTKKIDDAIDKIKTLEGQPSPFSKYDIENLSEEEKKEIKEKVKNNEINILKDLDTTEKLINSGALDSMDLLTFAEKNRKKDTSDEKTRNNLFSTLSKIPSKLLKGLSSNSYLLKDASAEINLPNEENPKNSLNLTIATLKNLNKITAADLMYGEKSNVSQEIIYKINTAIKEMNNSENFFEINNKEAFNKLLAKEGVDKEELKNSILKMITKYKDSSPKASIAETLEIIALAKEKNLISEEEFNNLYPEKI